MVKFDPDPGPTPDADLLDALGRGTIAAFEELYQRHRDWVLRLAYRFTGRQDDARDVLQDTFAYLLRKTPRPQLHTKLTTLLYPVVKNLAVTILRKRGQTLSNDALLDQVARPAPPGTNLPRAELPAALGALSESQRELLLMRFVDDLSLEEIAEALSIPVGTVQSRLHDAVSTLRNDPRTQNYFSP